MCCQLSLYSVSLLHMFTVHLLQVIFSTHPNQKFLYQLYYYIIPVFLFPQIKLGWKDYLFPLLARLSYHLEQQLPCSSLHTSVKKELPATTSNRVISVSNMSVHSISHMSQSLHVQGPQAGHHINAPVTKLPSFIPVPYAVADLALAHIPSPVLRVMGQSPSLWSDLPLQATIEKLIDSIPTAWKKVTCGRTL